jgi:hypothetical protein
MNRRLRSSRLLALVTLLAFPVSEAVAAPLVVETSRELTPADVADALVGGSPSPT